MARRDIRRARGRSLLIALMVMLPVGLLCYGFTVDDATRDDANPDNSLGGAQARIDSIDPSNVTFQTADGTTLGPIEERAAKPIDGYDAESGLPDQAAALQRLVKSPVTAELIANERVAVDDRLVPALVQSVSSPQSLEPKVELLSGRWPRSPSEVLITPRGEHDGLPTSGTLSLSGDGGERTVTVVGSGIGRTDDAMASLVSIAPERAAGGAVLRWLILGSEPIAWDEVRRLNEFGIAVTSRAVIEDPPDDAELDPAVREAVSGPIGGPLDSVAIVLAFTVFLFTALLVAPAFAVGAARQRRSLGLIASNGATTRQLRRSVLAQAIVLGVLAALVGAGLGTGVATGQSLVIGSLRPWLLPVSLTPPLTDLAAVVVTAIIAVVASALIPASRLGRLDIASVIRGHQVSPPLSRKLPAFGAATAAIGLLSLLWAFAQEQVPLPAALAGITGLVLGAIMTMPLTLTLAARLAGRTSMPVRMAARDAARHRSRAVPTMAAIMASAALATTLGVAAGSDDRQERLDYRAEGRYGEMSTGYLDTEADPSGRTTAAVIQAYAPELVVYERHSLGELFDESAGTEGQRFGLLLPDDCTVKRQLARYNTALDDAGRGKECALAGTDSAFSNGGVVLPAAELVRQYRLSGARADAVRNGAVVVTDPASARGSRLRIAVGLLESDDIGKVTGVRDITSAPVPAVAVSADLARANGHSTARALISEELAERRGLPTYLDGLGAYDPAGPISTTTERSVQEHLPDVTVVAVERGYSNTLQRMIRGIFGVIGLLIVVVTLIATALTVSEQQRDSATMAAVGATRRTRRKMAAAQAGLGALLGSIFGIALGLGPGIAFSYPLTTRYFDPDLQREIVQDPVIAVPWLSLTGMTIAVPLIAAGLAALAIRRSPAVTHRT
ncbi:MAG: FtsX-like permease family protein [Nocardioides sp.]